MEKRAKHNLFLRALHRVFMLRPVTAIFIPAQYRLDTLTWRLTNNRFSLTSLLGGLPTFQITTIGAKSRMPRRVPLIGINEGEKIVLIASNYGQHHHPAWYHNMKANPECHVRINGIDRTYVAREAEEHEYECYWEAAVSLYMGYAAYKTRAGNRHIPIMILEPRKEVPDQASGLVPPST